MRARSRLVTVMSSLVCASLCLDIRREHHPPAPRECELLAHLRCRRLPLRSPRQPRTRFLPRSTHQRSPSPRFRCLDNPCKSPDCPPGKRWSRSRLREYFCFHAPASLLCLFPGGAHRLCAGFLLTDGFSVQKRLFRRVLLLRLGSWAFSSSSPRSSLALLSCGRSVFDFVCLVLAFFLAAIRRSLPPAPRTKKGCTVPPRSRIDSANGVA